MKEKIHQILNEISGFSPENKEEIEQFRIKYLSKKGIIAGLFSEFKNVPKELRKETGQHLNDLKNNVQEKVNSLKQSFEKIDEPSTSEKDLSLPADFIQLGSRHPLSIIRNRIIDIFSKIGFTVSEGPEIEDDWHNFTALNFPEEHPARDMQDTFFIEKNLYFYVLSI